MKPQKSIAVPGNLIAILLAGTFVVAAALAADPQSAPVSPPPPPPSDAPPQINPLVEDNQAVTNTKPEKAKQIVQTSQTGGQTEVRVTNDIGTYIVKPNQNIGTSLPGDGQSNSNNPVQWVIKSWGGSKDTGTKDDAPPPKLQPNPNAPADK